MTWLWSTPSTHWSVGNTESMAQSWRHQAITRIYVDLSSVRSRGINVGTLSREIPQSSIIKIRFMISQNIKFQSNLSGPMGWWKGYIKTTTNIPLVMGTIITWYITTKQNHKLCISIHTYSKDACWYAYAHCWYCAYSISKPLVLIGLPVIRLLKSMFHHTTWYHGVRYPKYRTPKIWNYFSFN